MGEKGKVVRMLDTDLEVGADYLAFLDECRAFAAIAEEQFRLIREATAKDTVEDALASSSGVPSDGFFMWGDRRCRPCIDAIIEYAFSELIKRGCYDVDKDAYEETYIDKGILLGCVHKSVSYIKEIEEEEFALEDERQAKTAAARSVWSGGGFGGIKTALKGMVKAEALNLANGAIRGIINSFERNKSQSKFVQGVVEEFPEYRDNLCFAVRSFVLANVSGFIRCLREHGGATISNDWPTDEKGVLESLFKNLKSGVVPEKDRRAVALRIWKANPRYPGLYEWLYENEPDATEEIVSVAEFFCVPLDAAIYRRFKKGLYNCPCISMEEVTSFKAYIIDLGKKVHYDPREEVAALDARIAKLRKKEADAARRKEKERQDADAAAWKKSCTTFGVATESPYMAQLALGSKEHFFEGVKESVKRHRKDEVYFHVGTEIEPKERKSIAENFVLFSDERVLASLPGTFLGGFSRGLILTDWGIRWRNAEDQVSRRTELSWGEFAAKGSKVWVGKNENKVHINEEDVFYTRFTGIEDSVLANVLNEIKGYYRSATFDKRETRCAESRQEELRKAATVDGNASLEAFIVNSKTSGLYCGSNFPADKRENAIAHLGVTKEETVYAVADTTFFGSVKTGIAVTDWGLHWKNDWSSPTKRTSLSWDELRGLAPVKHKGYEVIFDAESKFNVAGSGATAEAVARLLNDICNFMTTSK